MIKLREERYGSDLLRDSSHLAFAWSALKLRSFVRLTLSGSFRIAKPGNMKYFYSHQSLLQASA